MGLLRLYWGDEMADELCMGAVSELSLLDLHWEWGEEMLNNNTGQWAALARLQHEDKKSDLRTHPRFVAHSMNCMKGAVSDFSATGLRITYKKCQKFEAGDQVELELYSPKGMHSCEAVVMWIDKKSRKCIEVGFKFVDPDAVKQMHLFNVGFDSLSSD
tara:strand:- start:58177 stop:58653 length:477 start_codon:yes stop_codon:yes gene_type:complete